MPNGATTQNLVNTYRSLKTFANPKTIRIIVPWMASLAELSA